MGEKTSEITELSKLSEEEPSVEAVEEVYEYDYEYYYYEERDYEYYYYDYEEYDYEYYYYDYEERDYEYYYYYDYEERDYEYYYYYDYEEYEYYYYDGERSRGRGYYYYYDYEGYYYVDEAPISRGKEITYIHIKDEASVTSKISEEDGLHGNASCVKGTAVGVDGERTHPDTALEEYEARIGVLEHIGRTRATGVESNEDKSVEPPKSKQKDK